MRGPYAKSRRNEERREVLARIRCTRPLTPEELAEEERLERRLVAHLWLREQAELEARLANELSKEDA